ncbi:outer membrane lipoprotein-sorting protein [Rhodohalobacter sp. SW132]|uniref:outer membrane lipoprotein-sorting protein n=1 Tax=Rhodohalobacter sp. SW132 TaxID=2293433 RepID=UPI000E22E62B|nr:outer membrane lipoprotein-sorting protein [Rhodohalobacter sp. SW132]REL24808.1 outer membrane lipoprotein-sorting protein [Rhodohalobacter sp. SW132]
MKSALIALFAFLMIHETCLHAQDRITDEAEARSVFEEVEDRRNSINTETATLEMIITDPRGRTRSRTMKMWSSTDENISRNLIVFSNPGNVSGTAFLTIRENGSSSQRLYLPSVGRIQTIGSSDRGDRFMGSDFTYEDLGDQQAEDYEFEWLENHENYYLVHASKPDSEQYSSVTFKIDREMYTLSEIHYFDDEGEKIKRLEAEDFEQLSDQLWSPARMTMYDLREDRKTELKWTEREINASVEDWRFTERGLQRGI